MIISSTSDWLGVLKHARKNLLAENTIVIPSSAKIPPYWSNRRRFVTCTSFKRNWGCMNRRLELTVESRNSTQHDQILVSTIIEFSDMEIELYRWDFRTIDRERNRTFHWDSRRRHDFGCHRRVMGRGSCGQCRRVKSSHLSNGEFILERLVYMY